MDETLKKVLEAREERWQYRQNLATGWNGAVISITLCVPHRFRTHPDFGAVFSRLCTKFEESLTRGEILGEKAGELDGADGPARFYRVRGEVSKLKALCVAGEEQLPGGRMLDIDLMDEQGRPVGREDVGLPPRRCFVCGSPAADCVSRRLHSRQQVEDRVLELYEQAKQALL